MSQGTYWPTHHDPGDHDPMAWTSPATLDYLADDYNGQIDPAVAYQIFNGVTIGTAGTATFTGGTLVVKPLAPDPVFDSLQWVVSPAWGSTVQVTVASVADPGANNVVYTLDLTGPNAMTSISVTAGGVTTTATRPAGLGGGGSPQGIPTGVGAFRGLGMRYGSNPDGNNGVEFVYSYQGPSDGNGSWSTAYQWDGTFTDTAMLPTISASNAVAEFFVWTGWQHSDGGGDSGNPPGTGPDGLVLASTLVDAFDGADATEADPAKWMHDYGSATIRDNQLSLYGILVSQAWNYNVDSAYVHLSVVPDADHPDMHVAFYATGQQGSPLDSWGFYIHVAAGVSELTCSWSNDDGSADTTGTLTYDPAAHAYLRLRSELSLISGDNWNIVYICEAGPAPGQWTELMRSNQVYTWSIGDGFRFVFESYEGQLLLDSFNAPAGVTLLYMKMPDGSYRKAGVAGQPLQFTLPDGSVREWPGSKYPLYQKQNDGTWLRVVG